MKKRIAMLMLAMVMVVMILAGCGGKKADKAPVIGEWKMSSIEVSGMSMDVDQFLEASGQSDVKMTLTIKEDGKFTMDVFGESADGTWEYKEPTCSLTVDGESVDAEYKDGKLVLSMDEGTMTFEK